MKILKEIDTPMTSRRGVINEYYNDLTQIKIGFQSILNKSNHTKMFK